MNWRRIRRLLLVLLAVFAVAFACVSWFVGGQLVATANRPVGPPPRVLKVEAVTIESGSGSTLAGWFVPCDNATATVILLHPLRGDRRAMTGRAALFHDAGYATILVDLQGHGESVGENITAGYRERLDVTATVEFARAKNPDHKLGVVGWSLGGAAAVLASPLGVDAMVLEAVYPTITDAVHNRVAIRLGPLHHVLAPALLAQLRPRLGISPSQLRPVDHIQNAGCPVLIIAGDCDLHTTLPETQRLFDAAREPKRLIHFEGAAHTDLLGYDVVRYRKVVAFLDANLE